MTGKVFIWNKNVKNILTAYNLNKISELDKSKCLASDDRVIYWQLTLAKEFKW